MNQLLARSRRPHRRGVLLPARARRRLRLPQAAAGPVRADRRALRRRPRRTCRVVGDSLRDLQAGAAAGCEPHLVRTGKARPARRAPSCAAVLSAGARHARCTPTSRAFAAVPARTRAASSAATRPSRTRCSACSDGSPLAALRSALFFAVAGRHRRAAGRSAVLVSSIFVRGEPLYWMCAGWLRLAICGARVICGVRCRVQRHGEPAAGRPAAPVHPAGRSTSRPGRPSPFPTLMPHPLAYVFKRELLLHPVLRLGDGAAGHDPHRPQQARRGLEQGGRAGPRAAWRRATGSSCSPRARARRAAARASTRPAARGWRSRPARRWCRSPSPRRAAGRARASCCGRA